MKKNSKRKLTDWRSIESPIGFKLLRIFKGEKSQREK
jgi:hypothetical protein